MIDIVLQVMIRYHSGNIILGTFPQHLVGIKFQIELIFFCAWSANLDKYQCNALAVTGTCCLNVLQAVDNKNTKC